MYGLKLVARPLVLGLTFSTIMPTLGHTNCPLPVRESVWFEYILRNWDLKGPGH